MMVVVMRVDTLVVNPELRTDTLRIPVARVEKLELAVLKKKSNALPGAFLGIVIGAGAGVAIFEAAYGSEGYGVGALAAAALGTLPGAAVGATIGAFVKSDGWGWKALPLQRLRVGFAPQRNGHFALVASVAF